MAQVRRRTSRLRRGMSGDGLTGGGDDDEMSVCELVYRLYEDGKIDLLNSVK